MQPVAIQTRWAKDVSPEHPLPEYPRPQMIRDNGWQNLNGLWNYSITNKNKSKPDSYQGKILVPFPLESALSGVKTKLGPTENLWYQRTFRVNTKKGEKTLLHFGAVDWQATVYVNGREVGTHSGGYTEFSFDITGSVRPGENELVIKVYDPTDKGIGPHGKQVLNPGNIYYTPSSGIWQTVWLETVATDYIERLILTPDIDKNTLSAKVIAPVDCDVEVVAFASGEIVSLAKGKTQETIDLPIKHVKLWSPESPFLYDLEVKLTKNGKVLDRVKSYFGMRKISIGKDEKGFNRIFLNNRYYYNLGTLDQGFWPEGLYTAPTDSALRFDILAIKAMGFNTIRKHIKVEPSRWYYYTDKLGMLVWQDMVNPNQLLPEGSKTEFEKGCSEILTQLHNYPSIITWVLFNEKWGQYDQARLTKWMKDTDPSRLVNGHSGEYLYVNKELRSPSSNAYVGADMTDVHAYPQPMLSIMQPGKAQVCGEFGGIGVPIEGHIWDDLVSGWGYDGVVTPSKMIQQYIEMIDTLKSLESKGLSASIYTQPFDVESEQNGLLTYDREVSKVDVTSLRKVNASISPVNEQPANAFDEIQLKEAPLVIPDFEFRRNQYNLGRKDSAFLRSLTIMAATNKDSLLVDKVVVDYITSVSDLFNPFNLRYLLEFSYHTWSPGFKLLLLNKGKVTKIIDSATYSYRIQAVIFNDEVNPRLSNSVKVEMLDSVISRYPQVDGEYIIGLSVVKFFNRLIQKNKEALDNAITFASYYDEKYKTGSYNAWAWYVFKNADKKEQLVKGLEWSRKEIMRSDSTKPDYGMYLDTYANLLYKLGNVKEALIYQEKAVKLRPFDRQLEMALSKMRQGKKTWN